MHSSTGHVVGENWYGEHVAGIVRAGDVGTPLFYRGTDATDVRYFILLKRVVDSLTNPFATIGPCRQLI